jgi:hypothetical protein
MWEFIFITVFEFAMALNLVGNLINYNATVPAEQGILQYSFTFLPICIVYLIIVSLLTRARVRFLPAILLLGFTVVFYSSLPNFTSANNAGDLLGQGFYLIGLLVFIMIPGVALLINSFKTRNK